MFFRTVNILEAVKVFLGHFKAHSLLSIVACQAAQLLPLFDFAEIHFLKCCNAKEKQTAPGIADFIQQTFNSYTPETRKNSDLPKTK